MNKPASELIALADCPFCGSSNISDRHVRDGRQMFCINCGASVAPTFHGPRGDTLDRAKEAWNTRTAANQSGIERAGVDALREALERMARLYESEYDADAPFVRPEWLRSALATPPAQTAPSKCEDCSGSGLALNSAGEPDICKTCGGNTVVPSEAPSTHGKPKDAHDEVSAIPMDDVLARGCGRLSIPDEDVVTHGKPDGAVRVGGYDV